MDHEEKYLFANQTYEKWFQLTHDEIIGRKLNAVLGPANNSQVGPQIRKVLATGETSIYEGLLQKANGEMISYHALYVADKDSQDGRINGCIILGTDITERKAVQSELEETKFLAEAANVTKSNFLANISHEIRTPLGAVLGFSELLLEKMEDSNEVQEIGSAIKRNGEQLLRLIEDLIDISKIETGHFKIHKQKINLLEVMNDIQAYAHLRATEKNIQLNFDYGKDVPLEIVSDRVRLKQCLLNIVGNAIKFTNPNGSVTVKTEYGLSSAGQIEVKISDSGIGISEENQKKLFQPFYHEVEKCLDLVPTETTTSSLTEKSVATVGQRLGGKRILVVEDSKDNQMLIGRFLKSEKADVMIAVDGADGVHKALNHDFDLVFMDIQMPQIDGYEALALLNKQNYQVPVVALTAHALKSDIDRSLKAGFKAHMTKPLRREELIQAVIKYSQQ